MKYDTIYLVVKADRTYRVAKRTSSIRDNEVAFKIDLSFPDSWGKVVGTIDIAVPDNTPTATHKRIPLHDASKGTI